MSKGSEKIPIPTYYMSIHFGICHEVDSIRALIAGEKTAWSGEITSNTSIDINKPNHFGGVKKEGGLKGVMEVFLGGSGQLVSDALATRLGREGPSDCPGFRGITSVFFRGSAKRGFYWAANNPYLKPIWFMVKRISRSLSLTNAAIALPSGELDANPAHVIYECYTNTDWGMGADPAAIDVASFLAAAQTLFDEGFGISMLWNRSDTIEAFVNQVLGHINGSTFTHPRTGKITLRLMRDDYDVATLREITPDKATIVNFSRKGWGETVNEMKVTWTNPANEQEETVYSQDIGNIAQQGQVVSDSRNYFGVRSAALAQKLCDRELRAASAPLCSMEVIADGTFWDITPLECVKVTWPELGLDAQVMRVTKVSYGRTDDSTIKLSLVEDIFAMPRATFVAPPGSGWVNPAVPSEPITEAHIFNLPAYMVVREGGDLSSFTYPESGVSVLAANPVDSMTSSFDLMLQEYTPSGGTSWVTDMEGLPFVGRGELANSLIRDVTSTISNLVNANGVNLTVDTFLLIGNTTPMELALVTAYDPDLGVATIRRGVLDTCPQIWPAGTKVWSFTLDDLQAISRLFTDGQSLSVKLLTNTTIDQTDEATAPVFTQPVEARAVLPLRPANVTINGALWPQVVEDIDATIAVAWSRRNRLLEDNVVLAWNEADVVPEDGTTYTVQLYRVDTNALVTETTGITGTSAAIVSTYSGIVKLVVTSVRDGLPCFQPFEHIFDLLTTELRITEDGDARVTEDGEGRTLES